MKTKEILLIMPAYNEEGSIGKTLEMLYEHNVQEKLDILVIDDGSRDHTRDVVLKKDIKVLSQVYNLGYGAALQTGYKYAVEKGYKYLLQMDSDGQHDVKNIDMILEKLIPSDETGKKIPDIVVGTRFIEGSQSFYVSRMKRVAITIFRKVIKSLTGYTLTDPTSGLQGLNRAAFSYYAQYQNFDIQYPDLNMIIQMLLMGYHIEEIPAIMHARTEGSSMHDGIFKVMKYMIIMTLSTWNSYWSCSKKRRT